MTQSYRVTVTDMMVNLGWSDYELADFYNQKYGTKLPAPILKHVRDPEARKLIAAMGQEIENRPMRRARY